MKKVAIDNSGISEKHGIRGAGFYAQRLLDAFEDIKIKDLKVEALDFKTNKEKLKEYSLLHYPYFTPFFLSLPLKKVQPTIVTLHDLIPIKFPKHFPKGIKGEVKWQLQKTSLCSAKAIITDSYSSKRDIIQYLKYDSQKVYVIYLAAGKEFEVLGEQPVSIKQKYNLPDKFVLYAGDLNWNKNLSGLIEAFYQLKKDDLSLVIVGKAFLNKNLTERIALVKLIKELNLYSKVKFLGFIPTKDLVAVYNLATVYCQPSFYEGFGLPVLEAMACGCPVVAANTSSIPEIAGKAAILVEPKPESIAKSLKKVIDNKSLQKELREKGIKQSKQFSWERTAKQTLKVYEKVIGEE